MLAKKAGQPITWASTNTRVATTWRYEQRIPGDASKKAERFPSRLYAPDRLNGPVLLRRLHRVGELLVACRDAPAVLEQFEEALDPVALAVERRAEARPRALPRPGRRAPSRASGRSGMASPGHRPGHESWSSVRLGYDPCNDLHSLLFRGVLMHAHARAVDTLQ